MCVWCEPEHTASQPPPPKSKEIQKVNPTQCTDDALQSICQLCQNLKGEHNASISLSWVPPKRTQRYNQNSKHVTTLKVHTPPQSSLLDTHSSARAVQPIFIKPYKRIQRRNELQSEQNLNPPKMMINRSPDVLWTFFYTNRYEKACLVQQNLQNCLKTARICKLLPNGRQGESF